MRKHFFAISLSLLFHAALLAGFLWHVKTDNTTAKTQVISLDLAMLHIPTASAMAKKTAQGQAALAQTHQRPVAEKKNKTHSLPQQKIVPEPQKQASIPQARQTVTEHNPHNTIAAHRKIGKPSLEPLKKKVAHKKKVIPVKTVKDKPFIARKQKRTNINNLAKTRKSKYHKRKSKLLLAAKPKKQHIKKKSRRHKKIPARQKLVPVSVAKVSGNNKIITSIPATTGIIPASSRQKQIMVGVNQAATRVKRLEQLFKQKLTRLIQKARYYPYKAKRMGMEGEVEVVFTLFANGEIKDIYVRKKSGSRLLDKAAIKTIKKISGKIRIPKAIDRKHWTLFVPIKYTLS